MNKKRALSLRQKSDEVAYNFSRPDREQNYSKEIFTVGKITPLSETTASVEFKKNTGKVGMAFFYWINMAGGQWKYFFPTYDHCVGAEKIRELLHNIEISNFPYNFKDL